MQSRLRVEASLSTPEHSNGMLLDAASFIHTKCVEQDSY